MMYNQQKYKIFTISNNNYKQSVHLLSEFLKSYFDSRDNISVSQDQDHGNIRLLDGIPRFALGALKDPPSPIPPLLFFKTFFLVLMLIFGQVCPTVLENWLGQGPEQASIIKKNSYLKKGRGVMSAPRPNTRLHHKIDGK